MATNCVQIAIYGRVLPKKVHQGWEGQNTNPEVIDKPKNWEKMPKVSQECEKETRIETKSPRTLFSHHFEVVEKFWHFHLKLLEFLDHLRGCQAVGIHRGEVFRVFRFRLLNLDYRPDPLGPSGINKTWTKEIKILKNKDSDRKERFKFNYRLGTPRQQCKADLNTKWSRRKKDHERPTRPGLNSSDWSIDQILAAGQGKAQVVQRCSFSGHFVRRLIRPDPFGGFPRFGWFLVNSFAEYFSNIPFWKSSERIKCHLRLNYNGNIIILLQIKQQNIDELYNYNKKNS